jgi:DNA polymerase III epsilon subunit-like protein
MNSQTNDFLILFSRVNLDFIQLTYPFTKEDLVNHQDKLDWSLIPLNPNIIWREDIIESFKSRLLISKNYDRYNYELLTLFGNLSDISVFKSVNFVSSCFLENQNAVIKAEYLDYFIENNIFPIKNAYHGEGQKKSTFKFNLKYVDRFEWGILSLNLDLESPNFHSDSKAIIRFLNHFNDKFKYDVANYSTEDLGINEIFESDYEITFIQALFYTLHRQENKDMLNESQLYGFLLNKILEYYNKKEIDWDLEFDLNNLCNSIYLKREHKYFIEYLDRDSHIFPFEVDIFNKSVQSNLYNITYSILNGKATLFDLERHSNSINQFISNYIIDLKTILEDYIRYEDDPSSKIFYKIKYLSEISKALYNDINKNYLSNVFSEKNLYINNYVKIRSNNKRYNIDSSIKLNYLFIDIETSGLINKDNNEFPLVLSISWIFTQGNMIIDKSNFYIYYKQNEFKNDAVQINKIDYDTIRNEGVNIIDVLLTLNKYALMSDSVVCHNIDFDLPILEHTFNQNNLPYYLGEKYNLISWPKAEYLKDGAYSVICTMKLGSNILFREGIKKTGSYVNLEDLYFFLFKKEIKNYHSSIADVEALYDIYFTLLKRYPKYIGEEIVEDSF